MSLTVSILAPLVTMFGAADVPADADAHSRRYAEIYVTSGVCALMGYSVDFDGLFSSKATVQHEMVRAGEPANQAAAQIARDIQFAQGRFTRTYGDFLLETADWPQGQFNTSIQHVTFHQTYQRRCANLAASPDGGHFLAAPEKRLSRIEIDGKIRDVMRARPEEG